MGWHWCDKHEHQQHMEVCKNAISSKKCHKRDCPAYLMLTNPNPDLVQCPNDKRMVEENRKQTLGNNKRRNKPNKKRMPGRSTVSRPRCPDPVA